MRLEGMRAFLSEDAISGHLAYYRRERCKYSILEKSIPEIRGKSLRELYKMPHSGDLGDEILSRANFLKSHELYFSSFCERRRVCCEIKKYYSSEAAFLYEISERALRMQGGFLYILRDKRGRPFAVSSEDLRFGRDFAPALALDMEEHAYFLDYRFNKERFISAALAAFDLNEIFSDENSRLYLDTPI